MACQAVQTAKYALAEVVNAVPWLNISRIALITGFRRAFALIPAPEQSRDETQPNRLSLKRPDPRLPMLPPQHGPVRHLENLRSLLLSQPCQVPQPLELGRGHGDMVATFVNKSRG
jgi:hypothetical protein